MNLIFAIHTGLVDTDAMNFPGIFLSEADGQVFLRGEPAPDRPAIDAAALHALLAGAGFGQWMRDDEAIANAATACNTQLTAIFLPVAKQCDATIEVQIAPDDMTATLSLTPAQGGKAATAPDGMRALMEAGVSFGIDELAVIRACELGRCDNFPVAQGVPQQNGHDAIFEALIPVAADRAPKLNEYGLIDYREQGSTAVVQSGVALMRRHPATAGVDGHTIRGDVRPAIAGHDEPFATPLAGAQVATDDSNLLLASLTGQPVRVQCGVMVEPILRVAEVNMATGNIHYEGTVHVEGEVTQGMTVEASGDIVVGGMVDGGLLKAGGDIRVAGGVIAHAQLRAGGSVSARFAEGSDIEAGTVINLDDMALECRLQSLNQIVIGTGSPQRGRLVGGTAAAMMLLKVPILGSEKGGTVKVLLGVNPELDAKRELLEQRIDKEKVAEENLHKLVKQLTAAGDPKGMLERVAASRTHAIQAWGKSLAEREELGQQIALGNNARLEVGVGVAGAIDLFFGKLPARVRREYGAGTFAVDADADGQIRFTDGTGYACAVV